MLYISLTLFLIWPFTPSFTTSSMNSFVLFTNISISAQTTLLFITASMFLLSPWPSHPNKASMIYSIEGDCDYVMLKAFDSNFSWSFAILNTELILLFVLPVEMLFTANSIIISLRLISFEIEREKSSMTTSISFVVLISKEENFSMRSEGYKDKRFSKLGKNLLWNIRYEKDILNI